MITLNSPFTNETFTNTAVLGIIDPMPELDEMITTREAWELAKSRKIKVSRAAISEAARRWVEDRAESGIPGSVKIGNTWLIPKNSFVDWIENRKPRGPEPA